MTRSSLAARDIVPDPYFITGAGKDYGVRLATARAELARIGMTETEFAELPGSVPLTMMPIERLEAVIAWAKPQPTADSVEAQFVAAFGAEDIAMAEEPKAQEGEADTMAASDLVFEVKDAPDALEKGVYKAKLKSIVRHEGTQSFNDKPPEDFFVWTFDVDVNGDGSDIEEESTTSSMKFTKGPKQVAKARKWAEAIIGRAIVDGEKFNLATLFGREVLLSISVNDETGYNKVDDVLTAAAPGRRTRQPAVAEATLDEVPF